MGRDVNRAVLARFITNAGAEAGFFIGIWGKAAYTFEAGPTALAVMTALIAFAGVVGNTVGGLLVDRHDARRVLIAAEVLLAPAVLSLIAADSLATLFAGGAVVFVLHGVEETSATSLPPALVDDGEEALVRVNARLEAAGWLAMVAGPGLGGLLAGFVDLDAVFVFDAATSLVAVAILLGVHLRPGTVTEPGDDVPTGWREVVAGLGIARRTPPIALAMVMGSLLWFAFGAFVALEPLYYRDILEVGPEVLGYVNAVFGLGMFIGSVVVDRAGRRFGFTQAVWLSVATGLGAVVYVGSASLWIVVVGAVLWSIPLGMFFPVVRTLAQRAAPEGAVGRVMGTIATAQNLTSVLPAAFVPWLAAAFGVQPVLVGGGLVPALAAPFLLATARRRDQEAGERPLEIRPDPHPTGATPLP